MRLARACFRILILFLVVGIAGCLDPVRLNKECRWIDAGGPVDARHIRDDALVGEELGLRLGDSYRGIKPLPERHAMVTACTDSIFRVIRRTHAVGMGAVFASVDDRDAWVDVVSTLVPVLLIYLLAVR